MYGVVYRYFWGIFVFKYIGMMIDNYKIMVVFVLRDSFFSGEMVLKGLKKMMDGIIYLYL